MTTASPVPAALITGGTSGIGLATARILHEKGIAVLVTGNRPDTIAAARRVLSADVVIVQADARSLQDAERVAEEVRRRFDRLDLVFLNAGVGRLLPLQAVDEAFYDEHFDINVKGQVFTLQKVLPLLGKGSSVIFNSALGAAAKGLPNWSIYSATKGALLSLVRALSVELAPQGIRVNAIVPGPIDTPAMEKLGVPIEALATLKQEIAARVPLGRFGRDEEVARAVAFLASPDAGFITGTNIVIDGGLAVV